MSEAQLTCSQGLWLFAPSILGISLTAVTNDLVLCTTLARFSQALLSPLDLCTGQASRFPSTELYRLFRLPTVIPWPRWKAPNCWSGMACTVPTDPTLLPHTLSSKPAPSFCQPCATKISHMAPESLSEIWQLLPQNILLLSSSLWLYCQFCSEMSMNTSKVSTHLLCICVVRYTQYNIYHFHYI